MNTLIRGLNKSNRGRLAAIAILVFAFLSLSPAMSEAPAQTLPAAFDLRAKDAVDMFAMQCVATRGDRANAEKIFGNGVPGANRLSPEVLAAVESGRTGGVGWVIRTPNNANFMLEFDPIGLCGIRLIEADQPSLRIAVKALARAAAVVAQAPLTIAPPVIRSVDGANVTMEHYSFPIPGHVADIVLSSSDHKYTIQQHILTLSYSKPQK